MSGQAKHFYEFDRFRVDAGERLLFCEGEVVPLTQKAFEVLLALLEERDRVVGKDELTKKVWPDSFVEASNLPQHIYNLRKALGKTPGGEDYIQTFPKRGYRFAAPVREGRADAAAATQAATAVAQASSEDARSPGFSRAFHAEEQNPAEAGTTNTTTNAESPPARTSPRQWALIATAALILIGAFAALWLGLRSRFINDDARRVTITSLTNTGNLTCAAISPDGKYVVYGVSDKPGSYGLRVTQLATHTSGELIAPGAGELRFATFTRDGNYVYFVRRGLDTPSPALYRVPLVGGVAQKILDDVSSAVSFSPDGHQFAFARWLNERREHGLFVANADGTGVREIAALKLPDIFGHPAWSPDGEEIACAAGHDEYGQNMRVVTVRVSDGAVREVGPRRWRWVGQMDWTADGRGLLMVASEHASDPFQVWRLDYPGGAASRVTNDSNFYNRLSVAAATGTLVALKRRQLSNVWLVPAEDAARAEQITFGAGGYRGAIAWTPDGRIVYASEEGSAATISVMNADGSRPQPLLGERTGEGYPSGVAVSPDGRHVVYSSDAGGTRHLWRMKLDGSDAAQLTRGGGESQPAYSPDGRWIVFTRLETPDIGRPTVWKISADGGELVQLTNAFSLSPAVSPNGKLVACFYSESVASSVAKIAVLPLDGGAPVRLLQTPIQNGLAVRWTRDGQHVTWAENHGATSRILTEPVEGGAARTLAEFGAEQVFGFDWSPDGRRLAVVRGIWAMDAVALRGF